MYRPTPPRATTQIRNVRTTLVDQNINYSSQTGRIVLLKRVIGASSHSSKGEHHNWKREVLATRRSSEGGALKPSPLHHFRSFRDVNGRVMDSNYQHSGEEGGSAPPLLSLRSRSPWLPHCSSLRGAGILKGEAHRNSPSGLLDAILWGFSKRQWNP